MNTTSINFLSRLKNCGATNKESMSVEYTNLVLSISRKLYEEGFIQSYKVVDDSNVKNVTKKRIDVTMRYYYDKPIFKKLKFLSTPSQKRYLRYDQLAQINTKKDVVFVSTNKGLLTIDECKKAHIGGVMFFVC